MLLCYIIIKQHIDKDKGKMSDKNILAENPTYNDVMVQKGKKFVETIWWQLAKRILLLAGEQYNWDDKKMEQMVEKFLRPNDYKVIIE